MRKEDKIIMKLIEEKTNGKDIIRIFDTAYEIEKELYKQKIIIDLSTLESKIKNYLSPRGYSFRGDFAIKRR